jgi:hypothetical protein
MLESKNYSTLFVLYQKNINIVSYDELNINKNLTKLQGVALFF